MVTSVFQYLSSLADTEGLTRTLGPLELMRNGRGEPFCSVGNSAVVFKVRCRGEVCKLRCYLRHKRNLRQIYRDRLLQSELFVYTDAEHGEWTDVVLDKWYDGTTLEHAMKGPETDAARMAQLASMFDATAAWLLSQEWAHGDLKPENIIVGGEGMHLIDFDAMYRPGMDECDCEESGTRAFQHPLRGEIFDKSIDDYPIALISTCLHALAADLSLRECVGDGGEMVDPAMAVGGCDPTLERIERLFATRGDALRYRIARLLRSPIPRLFGLGTLLEYGQRPVREAVGKLQLAEKGGLWGYSDEVGFVIPPLYDCGFEFSEGLAAVRTGSSWHFIDTGGRTVIDCSGCDTVKPFRNGRAEVVRGGRHSAIGRDGKELT